MALSLTANADMNTTNDNRPARDGYEDVRFTSADGLALYARDYPNEAADLTVLCLHGLTRSSKDFADLAAALQPRHRVLAMDQRGRGLSDRDPEPSHYALPTYVRDTFALLDHLGIDQVAIVGTSMGGLMAMFMAVEQPTRLRGVVMNDVGPVVESSGIQRISASLGKAEGVASWQDAAALARANNGAAFPDLDDEAWMAFARRTFVENDSGVPVLAYDPGIAKPMHANQSTLVPPDLWPVFDALREIPLLIVRGVLSDILSEDTLNEMLRRHPGAVAVALENRGHAPMLDEPPARQAIVDFLGEVARRPG